MRKSSGRAPIASERLSASVPVSPTPPPAREIPVSKSRRLGRNVELFSGGSGAVAAVE